MLKSRFIPVVLAFVILVCGTGYILSPKGDQAVQQGFQHAIEYLPTYGIALVIAIVAGYSIGLLAGKKNRDSAFSYGALIVFLLASGLSIFKDHLTMQDGQDLVTKGQQQIAKWLSHRSNSSHPETQAPARTATRQGTAPQASSSAAPGMPSKDTVTQLQRWSANIQHQLPQATDKYTQLSRISYSTANNAFSMRYDVNGFDSLGVDENEFIQSMLANMTKLYCHGVFFRPMFLANSTVYATFHYNHGGPIGSPVVLRPSLCK